MVASSIPKPSTARRSAGVRVGPPTRITLETAAEGTPALGKQISAGSDTALHTSLYENFELSSRYSAGRPAVLCRRRPEGYPGRDWFARHVTAGILESPPLSLGDENTFDVRSVTLDIAKPMAPSLGATRLATIAVSHLPPPRSLSPRWFITEKTPFVQRNNAASNVPPPRSNTQESPRFGLIETICKRCGESVS